MISDRATENGPRTKVSFQTAVELSTSDINSGGQSMITKTKNRGVRNLENVIYTVLGKVVDVNSQRTETGDNHLTEWAQEVFARTRPGKNIEVAGYQLTARTDGANGPVDEQRRIQEERRSRKSSGSQQTVLRATVGWCKTVARR
jgi:hypothetical protein